MMENTNSLYEQFLQLGRMLHHCHQRNHHAHGPMGNPHRGQGRVLRLLKMQPETSQRELSFLLDMRPQSLGELLGKLERHGYITRTQSEEDRRAINIKLTEAGAQATKPCDSADHTQCNELFDCLTTEEQQTLSGYLQRILTKWEESMGKECGHRGHCHEHNEHHSECDSRHHGRHQCKEHGDDQCGHGGRCGHGGHPHAE